MSIDRRDLVRGGIIGAGLLAAGSASAQTLSTQDLSIQDLSTQSPGARPPEDDLPADQRLTIPDWPAPSAVIPLWPGLTAPGLLNAKLKEITVEEGHAPDLHYRAVHGISQPRLCVFPAANPNGAAVIISPGGGYRRIAIDIEGYELAGWLNAQGITVFVLFYRLPAEGWTKAADAPLADAQRAIRLVRQQAVTWKIDPARVAMMGFSAGGHVCASLATRFDATVYEPVDAADALSARPLLCAPIYPVLSMDLAIAHKGSRDNLLGPSPTPEQILTYSPDRMVTKDTPPCFLTHAENDATVPVDNTLVFRAALKAAGVTVETHLFPDGGHGFGLRKVVGTPTHAWGELFLAFARARGLYT